MAAKLQLRVNDMTTGSGQQEWNLWRKRHAILVWITKII